MAVEVFLRKVGGHRAVGGGGDNLPQGLLAHIPHREYPGKVGAGGFVRLDIAPLGEGHLPGKELGVGHVPHSHKQI